MCIANAVNFWPEGCRKCESLLLLYRLMFAGLMRTKEFERARQPDTPPLVFEGRTRFSNNHFVFPHIMHCRIGGRLEHLV